MSEGESEGAATVGSGCIHVIPIMLVSLSLVDKVGVENQFGDWVAPLDLLLSSLSKQLSWHVNCGLYLNPLHKLACCPFSLIKHISGVTFTIHLSQSH